MFSQTAFALIKVFGMSGGLALGYFAAGCAPGGGSSNMYTYLLGGDVSLSVTMTLISIIASLGNRLGDLYNSILSFVPVVVQIILFLVYVCL